MPNIAHGCGVSDLRVYRISKETPKSYFPGTPGFQQKRALSLQLNLRNECFHSLKGKKRKKRWCIACSVTDTRGVNLPLALAVVAFIPLIALVCIHIVIALKRTVTQPALTKDQSLMSDQE